MLRTMLGLAVAVLLGGTAKADKYTLTGENTKIEFVGSKPEGKHTGGFKTVTGTADTSAHTIEVEIDVNSLYSDDPKLTAHLKAPDFFGVKEHPTAKFVSTKVEKSDKGHTIHGKLTMCGKTHEIHFPADIHVGETFTLKAEFEIDRTEFGMTYGKGKIDDKVKIKVDVTAKK